MSRILITRTLGNNTIILYGPVEERYSKLHVCDRLYPKSSSSPVRWLNSGSWIGFADTALEAYESVREVPRWFMDRLCTHLFGDSCANGCSVLSPGGPGRTKDFLILFTFPDDTG